MDETTNNATSDANAGPVPTGETAVPSSELAYAPHETDVAPDSGRTTRYADVPNPELVGQYARENILSYVGQQPADHQGAYNFGAALQSAIANPDSYQEFLTGMPARHRSGFQSFMRQAVASHPDAFAEELARHGYQMQQARQQPRVDPADPRLAELPLELGDVALSLDPATWDEISLLSPELRDRFLRQEAEAWAHEEAEQERREQEHFEAVEAASQEWAKEVQDFTRELDKPHFDHLAENFKPFTEDAANKQAAECVMWMTEAQMQADQYLMQTAQQVLESLADAADARFSGNHKAARQHQLAARKLADVVNREFRDKLDKNIAQFNLFFQHAPGRREAPAEQPQQYVN